MKLSKFEKYTIIFFLVSISVFIVLNINSENKTNQEDNSTNNTLIDDTKIVEAGSSSNKIDNSAKEDDEFSNSIDTTSIESNLTKDNLDFLISTNGIYPKDINLLEDSVLKQRLINLIGNNYYFLAENWNVETPIKVKNNTFIASGCQSQNCDITNFIIIIDFSKGILYCGIRENDKVKSFSEDGSNNQKLADFVLGKS